MKSKKSVVSHIIVHNDMKKSIYFSTYMIFPSFFTVKILLFLYLTAAVGEKQWYPCTEKYFFNDGSDIVADYESEIFPATGGTVTEKAFSQNRENRVVIQHEGDHRTLYTHLKSFTCKSGGKVRGNSRIGLLGSTGDCDGVLSPPLLNSPR